MWFIHRRTIEGILNSGIAGDPSNDPGAITPWLMALGAYRWEPESNARCHPVTREFLVDQLAMLRAKRLSELLVWWDANVSPNVWPDFKAAMEADFKPKIYWVSAGLGTPTTGMELDRLRYTLRPEDQSDVPETIEMESAAVGESDVVEIIASFIDAVGVGNLRFNLECAVTDPDVRGRVYVFNGLSNWIEVPITDFETEPGFGFFAPIDPSNMGGVWYRTRRTIVNVPNNLSFGNQVVIKVALHRPRTQLTPVPFNAAFDLLQLVGTHKYITVADGDSQGADFDYSGSVTPTDMAAYFSAWQNQSPAADSNGDGVIDATDLTLFIQKYNQ